MIDIKFLRKRYKKIIFWGMVKKLLDPFLEYMGEEDYVVDSNPFRQNFLLDKTVRMCGPEQIESETGSECAIVILPLNYEMEIYRQIRKTGFSGDIYAADMISFSRYSDNDNQYIVTDGSYTIEKHTQMLISLLKEYGIKKVVISPGICNMNFVYSVESDPYFTLYSCIDERSAAYMACGIALETGMPVAISCTGATASRNYMPALTEAFYSRLPIVAITSSRDSFMIDNGIEQVTNRLQLPADVVRESVELTTINTEVEKKYCELKINRALSRLKMHGGGPVHINLITHFERDFSTKTLPQCKKIEVICQGGPFPDLCGRTAFYVRPGVFLSNREIHLIEQFCEQYDAVVIGDHLSNYRGKYFVDFSLLALTQIPIEFDLLIYAGNINRNICINAKKSWRISRDGRIEDSFLNQEYMFDMELIDFFEHYTGKQDLFKKECKLYKSLTDKQDELLASIGELPFSNMYIARELAPLLPADSVCFFGIYSTLRNWSYFKMNPLIRSYSTVGGYGIDGTMSAMIGGAITNENTLHFCFLGDLSFFYDLNALGNRHIGNNIRIMMFNNNGGNSLLYKNGLPHNDIISGYVGAKNHFLNENSGFKGIKAFVESIGFKYIVATDKEEFKKYVPTFLEKSEVPVFFEIKYPEQNDFTSVKIMDSLS